MDRDWAAGWIGIGIGNDRQSRFP
uniref:Uncharacterized protein n=1 Tax=Triticum urartu TaxID=4572 RepID=A0A8R7PDR4_TRIUA